ncbi:MAG TPA: hypothetical protein PLV68_13680, partial [Ilumatobacteraceae bacterium]|nr:hypothetical protein [Ilumatobacteraceae bacterium]
NPNSIEIALVLLAWVGAERARLAGSIARADAWWIAAPLAAAVVIRPVAAVAAAAVIVALAVSVRTPGRRLTRGLRPVVVAVLAAAGAAVAWNVVVGVA